MRPAASTVPAVPPSILERKSEAEAAGVDGGHRQDEWRERMVMGQRTVQAAATGSGNVGGSRSAEASGRGRSVSPRKPQWTRAGTSPRRSRDSSPNVVEPTGQPAVELDKSNAESNDKPRWQSSRQARAAKLARHRNRSTSPRKAREEEQLQEESPAKSVLNQPASGNRVRWSLPGDVDTDDDDDGIDEAMIIGAATNDSSQVNISSNRSASPPKLSPSARDSQPNMESPRSSRSRANAALQARRRHQAQGQDRRSRRAVSPPKAAAGRAPQDPQESPTFRQAQPHHQERSFSPPLQPRLEAPEDEGDELSLPASSPPRLGINRTDYGRGNFDHTQFDDDSDYTGQDSPQKSAETTRNTDYTDEFDVDLHPEAFGSEDEESSQNSTPAASPRASPPSSPRSSPRSFAERKQMAALGEDDEVDVMEAVDRLESTVAEMELTGRTSPTRDSKAASFVVSIADVELFGAKELSLAFASMVEPTVDPLSLVNAALADSVRAEESQLMRQRGIDFVTARRAMGHSSDRLPGQPIRHLDDIMEDVVLAQEIALDKLEIGDYEGAMGQYMAVVTKCEDGTYQFADERVQDQLTGTIMHNIAVMHMKLGVFDICPQLWDETVLTRRDANPELGIFQHDVATSLNEMGISLFACGQHDKAVRAFADVIYIRQEIHGINNAYLASAINNIGIAHFALESSDKALEAFEEALQVYRLAMLAESEDEGDSDESGIFDGAKNLLLGISTTLCNVAYVRATQGAYAEAREALNEALEIQEAVLDAEDPRIEASFNMLSKIPQSEDTNNPPPLGLTASGIGSFAEDSQVGNPFHDVMGGFKDNGSDFDPFCVSAGYDSVGYQGQKTMKPSNVRPSNRQISF